MNRYDEAIRKGEQKEFLLGRSEYFYLDMLWGDHDSSRTAIDQLEYAQQHGEDVLQLELNKDISNALKDMNISEHELGCLINYISIYHRRKKDGDYKTEWKIPDEIKKLIKDQITFKEAKGLDLNGLREGLRLMKSQDEFSLD